MKLLACRTRQKQKFVMNAADHMREHSGLNIVPAQFSFKTLQTWWSLPDIFPDQMQDTSGLCNCLSLCPVIQHFSRITVDMDDFCGELNNLLQDCLPAAMKHGPTIMPFP